MRERGGTEAEQAIEKKRGRGMERRERGREGRGGECSERSRGPPGNGASLAAPTSEQQTLGMQLSSSALISSLSSHVALSTGLYSCEPQLPHPAKESIPAFHHELLQ